MNQSILRLSKELADIQKSADLSLAVACKDADIRNLTALITGPPDTPYEFGFFEFVLKFGKEYPQKAPSVNCITTNGGRCRFNPNIYATGKVCLSILGTWRGEKGEQWSSAQGLESILLSIQSLMSSNPFENEPGYELARTDADKKLMKEYVDKIRHETLRVSVIQRMEGYLSINTDGNTIEKGTPPPFTITELTDEDEPAFEPFMDLCKRRFLWYFDTYISTVQKYKAINPDKTPFTKMPFEGSGNEMKGSYDYSGLESRLNNIFTALLAETEKWALEGSAALKDDLTVAQNLRVQYEDAIQFYKHSDRFNLDISLANNNPFVWHLSYFGRPMTNLDGGLLSITVHFSPRWPAEEPRVFIKPAIFHFRISPRGVPCYINRQPENVRVLLENLMAALEEDKDVPYDPRMCVHPEANRLFWAGEQGRKEYTRRLRREVERSMDM